MHVLLKTTVFLILSLSLLAASAFAQTTAFNFQGRMNDGTSPANGRYDLQFKLFDAIAGGGQIAATVDRPGTMLVSGVFSTTLDFGPTAFNGGARFIEISVRPNGSSNPHIILGARQQIMSVPFAVRSVTAANADLAANSLNSQQLAGFNVADFIRNIDSQGTPQPASVNVMGSGNFATLKINGSIGLNPPPAVRINNNGVSPALEIQQGDNGIAINTNGQILAQGKITSNSGIESIGPVSVVGNTTQNPVGNGMVKAMLAVTASAAIARCYNGVTGSSTVPCGFTVELFSVNQFKVTFPFQVNNRFWMVTADASATESSVDVNTRSVLASTGRSDQLLVATHENGSPVFRPFHLFVY